MNLFFHFGRRLNNHTVILGFIHCWGPKQLCAVRNFNWEWQNEKQWEEDSKTSHDYTQVKSKIPPMVSMHCWNNTRERIFSRFESVSCNNDNDNNNDNKPKHAIFFWFNFIGWRCRRYGHLWTFASNQCHLCHIILFFFMTNIDWRNTHTHHTNRQTQTDRQTDRQREGDWEFGGVTYLPNLWTLVWL